MPKNFLYACAILMVCLGCAYTQREEIIFENGKVQKYFYSGEPRSRGDTSVFVDPVNEIIQSTTVMIPPEDMPLPKAPVKVRKPIRLYTGIIQNHTQYDISIPSGNSAGTLVVPARSYLEYNTWDPRINLYGYVDGKQIYYQKIVPQHGKFKYLGRAYDFVAQIKGAESLEKPKPVRKKRPGRKKPQGEGEGLG
jgi:hypothetical protein